MSDVNIQPSSLAEARTHATVQAASEHYLRALREACPAGPVHLLGHSFGGGVAFEMALRLHQPGRPPASRWSDVHRRWRVRSSRPCAARSDH